MIAAGWSDSALGGEVTRLLRAWFDLLETVIVESAAEIGDLGPFNPRSLATLVGLALHGWRVDVAARRRLDRRRVRRTRRVGALLRRQA